MKWQGSSKESWVYLDIKGKHIKFSFLFFNNNFFPSIFTFRLSFGANGNALSLTNSLGRLKLASYISINVFY